MSHKNDHKIDLNLAAQLYKLSTSIFIGYQSKFFSLLENGTKIGYKNLNDTDFDPQNIFMIRDCAVCEAEQEFSFTLETPKRQYTLKAKDEHTKLMWMRTITQIRKQIIRKKFKIGSNKKETIEKFKLSIEAGNQSIQKPKILASSTENTLPNLSLSFLHETMPEMKGSQLAQTERSMRLSARPTPNPQRDLEIKKDFSELLKTIPEYYLKYNVYIVALKSKVENLFTATFSESVYMMFSSKCLYRECAEEVAEDNLTNMMLPAWAEVNKVYKVGSSMQTPKLLVELSKIIDIEEPNEEKTCLKLRTVDTVHAFYCKTVEQKDRLREKFEIGIENYKEVMINGRLTRKNYDRLVYLHSNRPQLFSQAVEEIVEGFKPKQHKFEPQVTIKCIDMVIAWIQQFTLILGSKRQNCGELLLQVLKQVHEQIKIQIKLTWDSCYSAMKGEDILKFLNALAAYHSIIKGHITDIEFMNGMKQLSKIYVRLAWANFEDIILGIVQQQKKLNIFVDEDNEHVETNAIVDLFKFIYEVFDLAAPCWDHKLHLHNVQKLMCHAMAVFIVQLKAIVDQTVIPNQQLIAIANNYFRFSLTLDQFYTEKFTPLQQKTKDSYDKLKTEFKQLSNIILDKLAFDIRVAVKKLLEKSLFFKLDVQKLCHTLKQTSENVQITSFHPIFVKRFYEKIFTAVREGLLCLIQKELSSKKKPNVNKILDTLDSISFDLVQIAKVLFNGKTKIDKELNEVNILLSCENHNEILKMIKGSEEDIKRIYLNLLNLRQDYYTGAPLYYLLNEDAAERSSVAFTSNNLEVKGPIRPSRLTISKERQMRASFSSYYIANDFDSYSSVSKSEKDYDEPLRLISEGYLMKCKTNKKIWEKEYFRLKNATLYFYQNQSSERCQNSISVSDMINVYANESLHFTIEYTSLNRQKTIQFKCESVQLRDRWVQSVSLELRRVKNDEKVKRQKLKLNQPKKKYLIIDYQELVNGKDYFSYSGAQ